MRRGGVNGELGAVMSTPAAAPAMLKSVYAYIWRVSGRQQVILCLLTAVVVALAAAPFAVGGWLVIKGSVPLGSLVVFISGVQKVSDPWDQLITFYRTASNTQAKYELIRKTLHGDGEAPAPKP